MRLNCTGGCRPDGTRRCFKPSCGIIHTLYARGRFLHDQRNEEYALRLFCRFLFVFGLVASIGCGNEDLNKDLKPVDPKTPAPRKGGEGVGPKAQQKQADKAPSTIP